MRENAPRLFNRDRAVQRRRRLIERLHSPRLQMAFIAALTGASGLLASYLLRLAGLSAMVLRYPIAVGLAYVAFLFFLWCWLRWGDDNGDALDEAGDAVDVGTDYGDAGSSAHPAADAAPDSGDLGIDGVDGEGALIGIAIVGVIALCTALFAVFSLISLAPVLFAELLVDAALAGGLYRHVRRIDRERHWLKTAVARTGWRFAAVATIAAGIGWGIAHAVPGADSIGALLH
ncbi:MAG: hypothetical protein AMXMBFR59_22950 [Rhodanobacteraceae bacterium]